MSEENNELDIDAGQDAATAESSEVVIEDKVDMAEGVDTSEIKEEIREDLKSEAATTQTVSSTGGTKSLPKLLVLLVFILALGAGLVFWKTQVMDDHSGVDDFNVSKTEMETLLKDFPPQNRKALAENPEQKKQFVNGIKEMLAIASQAEKEGFNDAELTKLVENELKFSEKAVLASSYDRKINSDKGPMPPFGFITEDRVKEFWGEGKDMGGLSWIWNGAKQRRHEAEFKKFLDTKIELARRRGQLPRDREPSEEEIKQAKDAFAKTMIYYKEAKEKLASISSMSPEEQKEWKEFKETVELQTKLQKAQLLSQLYSSEVLRKKSAVTDADIQKYLAENPELVNEEDAKKKAEELLAKVKDGGDFAELAKEFSDDPGSKAKGGLYEGITKGQFAPEFEAAVFDTEIGKIVDKVVKTNFGYHIIRVEDKGEVKGSDGKPKQTFDARHILISTMVKDPDNPAAREQPVEQLVKSKLTKEKTKAVLDEIKKNNSVQVAEDFVVPEVSEEELEKQKEQQMKMMQQRMKQQQQMQQQSGQKPPAATAPKPKEEKK